MGVEGKGWEGYNKVGGCGRVGWGTCRMRVKEGGKVQVT